MGGGAVHRSDPGHDDAPHRHGFSVCFSIPRAQQSELGEALVAQPAPTVVRAN